MGYQKNPVIHLNSSAADVFLETIGHLLSDKGNLPFLSTLGVFKGEFAVLNITGC